MSSLPLIGVLGGCGAVGKVTVRLLKAWKSGFIRIGGRNHGLASELVRQELQGMGEAVAVDLNDPVALARFCQGCRVVVNCAGPSYHILDRVALAAFAAGADYVDPGGDEPLHNRLAHLGLEKAGRTALLTAGMMPGLSGLLPRWLALQGFDRAKRLTAYVGGRGRLTPAGAADYVLSLSEASANSLAAWRNGARVPRALEPLADVDLPFFPAGLTAHPYLSSEAERIARLLRLQEVLWYNVFEGGHMLSALAHLQGAASGRNDISAAVAELMAAVELDLFGRSPYQILLLHLEGEAAGAELHRTVMLRAVDAHELTGAMNALAVSAVLKNEVQPGLNFAADALDPHVVDRLADCPAVLAMELIEGTPTSATVEEGAL